MKRILTTAAICLLLTNIAIAQQYFTKNGNISFFSKTDMENIEANNNQVVSVIKTQTGDLQFSLTVKGFHFEKALMEEHFNENYMESEKYPKASFKGTIADIGKVNFTTDGKYPVSVSGELTIHGVTNKVNTKGVITVSGGKINSNSVFTIALADYKIVVPKLVESNISKTIQITVNCLYDQKM